jgi:hypothetical protein
MLRRTDLRLSGTTQDGARARLGRTKEFKDSIAGSSLHDRVDERTGRDN